MVTSAKSVERAISILGREPSSMSATAAEMRTRWFGACVCQ